ncbi:MAG: DUF493 domain-containing protein [Planctomycetaceae bacterium]|nr:DUF493 domain-containing protein [Planctomycetaceae bacterium]
MKSHLPPKDLLEATHQFPCPYTFKIIGEANEQFIEEIVGAVRLALELEFDPPYQQRESAGGRHVALTFEPMMQSSEEVLAVYSEIQKSEHVILLL